MNGMKGMGKRFTPHRTVDVPAGTMGEPRMLVRGLDARNSSP